MRVKEIPSVKCSQYATIPRSGAFPFSPDRGIGPSLTTIQRTMINSWPRGVGFSHVTSPTSFPCSSFAGNMCCLKCSRNHTGNCFIGKQCFACSKLGHMRRDIPNLQEHPGASKGTGRQTPGIAPTVGPTVAFQQPASTTHAGLRLQCNNLELKEE